MEAAREPPSPGRAQPGGQGVQSLGPVEVDVLASVERVEAGHPEEHRPSQEQGEDREFSRRGQPGAHRGDGQSEPEHEMTEGGESFGQRVEADHGQGHG